MEPKTPIKSGELIHVGNQVLVDRAQTAGPGSLNIPQEHIYELGNYQGVGIVRDIPDLKFSLESLDASAQLEALLLGLDFSTMTDGTQMDISRVLALDVASQFKKGRTADVPYEVEASVAIPFVLADSIQYRFGLKNNAAQTVSLSGDALYFAKGSAYVELTAGTNAPGQTITLANTAIPYEGDTTNGVRYALGVTTVAQGKRLIPGTDYTEAATGAGTAKSVTITLAAAVPTTDKIRVIYQSDVKTTYPQASHALASAVKPAALRGRDIEVRVGGTALTNRWSSVQNFDLTWSVTLDRDEEFGNFSVIAQDFFVPSVKGT